MAVQHCVVHAFLPLSVALFTCSCGCSAVESPLGSDLLRQGREVFNELRNRFQRQIGRKELLALEAQLAVLIGDTPVRRDAPGWVAQAI